jgi:hypothetical protein
MKFQRQKTERPFDGWHLIWLSTGRKGAEMAIERQKEIRRRRKRKARVRKLKQQLAEAKTLKERERLIELIQRRQPYYKPPEK